MPECLMQTPPGSRDMGNSPRPIDMSFRPHDLAGMEIRGMGFLGNAATSGRGLVPYDKSVRNPSSQDPLAQWYETNDGPWIPKDLAPADTDDHNRSRMNGVSFRVHPYAFSQYREMVPSECDTVPPGIPLSSDSGYGSNGAKRSVATCSVYDELDRSAETQSLVGNLTELEFDSDMRQKNGPSRYTNWNHPQGQSSMIQRSSPPSQKDLVCDTCRKTLKTNSELKKHKQRHTKPHQCKVEGCTRNEGFSTINDLDRHKRSVHPSEIKVQGNRYQCPHGTCKSKVKIWPRADNFRAHLKRVHRQDIVEDDFEKYIVQMPTSAQQYLPDLLGMSSSPVTYHNIQFSPSMDALTQGLWTPAMNQSPVMEMSPQDTFDEREMSQSVDDLTFRPMGSDHIRPMPSGHEALGITGNMSMTDRLPAQSERTGRPFNNSPESLTDDNAVRSQFVTPEVLSQSGGTPFSMQSERYSAIDNAPLLRDSSEFQNLSRGIPVANSTSADTAPVEVNRGVQNGEREAKGNRPPNAAALGLDLNDSASMKELVETLAAKGILEDNGFKKDAPTESKGPESTASSRHESQNSCPTCQKSFARRCELKKHLKRHEKPYGCTFHGCNKKFGSKNDWKRHENSQHFLLEVWKCNERKSDNPSEICGKVNHRRESFKSHLLTNHNLNGLLVDLKLEHCRVGRNCEARFWCGFCQQIIEIKQKGLNAWTERFNHIDDHFSGRNELARKQIDDWKSVELDAPPTVNSPPSDEDDCASESLNSSSPPSKPATTGDDGVQGQSRRQGMKRKMDDEEESHHSKKMRRDRHAIDQTPFTRCCQCAEGNSGGMSVQCVGATCQHVLCSYCY